MPQLQHYTILQVYQSEAQQLDLKLVNILNVEHMFKYKNKSLFEITTSQHA